MLVREAEMMEPNAFLVNMGLFVDIFAAALIAVPDFPPLARRTKFGALDSALDKIDSGGISEDEEGFEEIYEILRDLTPLEEANETPNDSYMRIEQTSRSGLAAAEAQNSPVNWGDEYIEGFYAEENSFAYSDFYQINPVYEKAREEIRKGASTVRAIGFFLLAGGFLLQIIGNSI